MNWPRHLTIIVAAALMACVPAQDPSEPVSPTVAADIPATNAWFNWPCASDSVDDFEWTRYDLGEIRIRVPREFRRVPFPSPDELHFQSGQATLRLRLHNDASQLFAQYYRPDNTFRHCFGELAGLAVEAISFRPRATAYGFAARWADADRGEWLTAIVQGRSLDQVTLLRRALLTLAFPGEKR